jgi:hypothetical protein
MVKASWQPLNASKRANSNQLVYDFGFGFLWQRSSSDFHNFIRKLLKQDGPHADVSFEFTDGTNVRAHRAILSVRSPVVLF